MNKNQIAQGVLIASALAAVTLLGAACSPVTSSITKAPYRNDTGKKVLEQNDEGSGSVEILSSTFVSSRSEFRATQESLPEGLKEVQLKTKELAELKEKSAVIVTIPGVRGSLRIFTILEVSTTKDAIAQKNLDEVEVKWTKLNPKGTEYALTLVDDQKTNAKRDLVIENLVGVTFSYQELE